ncbi:gamma-aminobutyric acid type B receptor subunit 2-like [Aulostomus maculatus]
MDRHGYLDTCKLLLLCWLGVGAVLAQVRHPLPVLWLIPVGAAGKENVSDGVSMAVRLALQDLQIQPPPLGNYEVQLQVLGVQCEVSSILRSLFDAMWAGPKYLLLFGGVCPSVTPLIARALPALNLVQVSFAATSPSLSNRKWYGNLFSTVPSDRAVNQATVKLLQRYKWMRVGIISQEGPQLSEMRKDLIRQLTKANVAVVSTERFSDDACNNLRKLKDHDVRILIGQLEDETAAEVLCCAYKLNLFGPWYQWILAGGIAPGWSLHRSGCPSDSLLKAADGSIRLQTRQLRPSSTPGLSGRTPQEYLDTHLRQLTQQGSEVSPFHAFAYDAVWVAAKALSQVMEAVKRREKYSVNRNITISEEEVEKTLLEVVRQTQFEGMTGPVFFRNGERMGSIELIQFQGGADVFVGEFNTSTQQLRLFHNLLKFKGSGPPKDQTQVRLQRRIVTLRLFCMVFSVATVTITVTLMVLAFVLINLRWRLCRWSAASQDELLLLGILLSSSSVLVSGLDDTLLSDRIPEGHVHLFDSVPVLFLPPTSTSYLYVPPLRPTSTSHLYVPPLLPVSTSRLYVPPLPPVPTARLYVLPLRPASTSRLYVLPLPPWPADCLLLCLTILDVLVLTSWTLLDPLSRVEAQHSPRRDPADGDAVIQPVSEHCSSANMELWLTAIYAYKAPLLGLGCFLAWNIWTAPVNDKGADSKCLALSMLAVTVFSVAGASGSLLTSHNPPLHYCLTSGIILSCNISILSWLFGAKLETNILRYILGLQGPPTRSGRLQTQVPLFLYLWRNGGQLLSDAEEDAADKQTSRMNQQLKSWSAQLDLELQTLAMQLCATSPSGVTCGAGHANVCADINAPELVRRRRSLQLPILHHSYLPVIGGVSASSSSLLSSCEAFVYHDTLMTTSCSHDDTLEQPPYH